MNKSDLQQRRLTLLQEIAERADQIKRIDDRLKSITTSDVIDK